MSDTWEDNEYAKRARGRLRDAAALGEDAGGDFEHRKAQIELQIGALMLQERSVQAQELQALTAVIALDPEVLSGATNSFWDLLEEAIVMRAHSIVNADAERIQKIIHGGV